MKKVAGLGLAPSLFFFFFLDGVEPQASTRAD